MHDFVLEEATVAEIQRAFSAGRITCVDLVERYLDRIAAYDAQGPCLRAMISLNPRALAVAAACDRERAAGGLLPPLHGIPLVLKDNFDTADMPTTGGATALAGSVPLRDAFVVRRLRAAGAIVLGKTNLTELARAGTTESSLGGQTKNPYDLTRTPGGSSGGTAAAVAANFAAIGTGSDTAQSVRSPASACALVGLRPTRGLVSRCGIMPLSPTQDEVGPLTRTVEDAARMLDVLAGYDADDPITAAGAGHIPQTYMATRVGDGLRGARLGVVAELFGHDAVHHEVNRVARQAIARMAALGADVIEVSIPRLDELTRDLSLISLEFKAAFDAYLTALGAAAPITSMADYMARAEFPSSLRALFVADAAVSDGPRSAEHRHMLERRMLLQRAVADTLTTHRIDALLYPHQRRLVVPIGEEQVERNGVLSNSTGFPALTFPAGYSTPTTTAPLGVPIGIELLGRAWTEPTLLKWAYAFEQAARVRMPPARTPPLR
jgi:amidase